MFRGRSDPGGKIGLSYSLSLWDFIFRVRFTSFHAHASLLLLLLLLLKEVGNARLGESDQHPITPKTPTPQHQPIERRERENSRR